MKISLAALILIGLVTGGFMLHLAGSEPQQVQADKKESKPDKKKVKELMDKKLVQSQLLLAALVKNDLEGAAKHADELKRIRGEAAWLVVKTDQYDLWSKEFTTSADHLIKAATEKNPDAARLAYLELTTTCFHCHTYVRDIGDIQFQENAR